MIYCFKNNCNICDPDCAGFVRDYVDCTEDAASGSAGVELVVSLHREDYETASLLQKASHNVHFLFVNEGQIRNAQITVKNTGDHADTMMLSIVSSVYPNVTLDLIELGTEYYYSGLGAEISVGASKEKVFDLRVHRTDGSLLSEELQLDIQVVSNNDLAAFASTQLIVTDTPLVRVLTLEKPLTDALLSIRGEEIEYNADGNGVIYLPESVLGEGMIYADLYAETSWVNALALDASVSPVVSLGRAVFSVSLHTQETSVSGGALVTLETEVRNVGYDSAQEVQTHCLFPPEFSPSPVANTFAEALGINETLNTDCVASAPVEFEDKEYRVGAAAQGRIGSCEALGNNKDDCGFNAQDCVYSDVLDYCQDKCDISVKCCGRRSINEDFCEENPDCQWNADFPSLQFVPQFHKEQR